MNRMLNVYADAEAFFDPRRGILQYMMTEGITDEDQRIAEGDRLWALHVERNYKARKFDTFNYPEFGIDEDKFKAVFATRGVEHWGAGMYYPSRLIKQLVTRIIDIEGLNDKPVDIKGVTVYVNTFPYAFTDEHLEVLAETVRVGLRGLATVKTFYSDPATHDATFYKQYQYVFRYNMLLDATVTALNETFRATPIPETTFVIPDVICRGNDTFGGNTKDWMLAGLTFLQPALKLLPIEHSLYDYDDD